MFKFDSIYRGDGPFWIGAYKEGNIHSWKWNDGTKMNYTDPIQDGTDPIRHHCLFYHRGKWHDQLCWWKMLYICSVPKSATELTTPATQNTTKTTSTPTTTTLNPIFAAYYFSNKTFLNWADAEKECNKQNGRLASIHSIEENNYLREEVHKRFVFRLRLKSD